MHIILKLALVFLVGIDANAALAAMKGQIRKQPVDLIVLHATGYPYCDPAGLHLLAADLGNTIEVIEYYRDHESESMHYVIGKDGALHSLVPEDEIAHHAGKFDTTSIGVALVNKGDGQDPFPDEQIAALVGLLKQLVSKYDLDSSAVKPHSEISRAVVVCNTSVFKKDIDPGGTYPGSPGNFPLEIVRQALSKSN